MEHSETEMHRIWGMPELVVEILRHVATQPEHDFPAYRFLHPSKRSRVDGLVFGGDHDALRAMAQVSKDFERLARPFLWESLNYLGLAALDAILSGSDGVSIAQKQNPVAPLPFQETIEYVKNIALNGLGQEDVHLTNLYRRGSSDRPLFPNLHSLGLCMPFARLNPLDGTTTDITNWALELLDPQLEVLGLHVCRCPALELVLDKITEKPLRLKSFICSVERSWGEDENCFLDHIDRWNTFLGTLDCLQHIELSTDSNIFATPVMTTLGGLPQLRSICIPDQWEVLCFPSDDKLDVKDAFPALRTLSLYQLASIPSITNLLKSIRGPLETLEVSLGVFEIGPLLWEQLSKFTSAVLEFEVSLKSLSITLEACTEVLQSLNGDPAQMRWDPFRCLMRLGHITSFQFFAFCGRETLIDFGDSDLEALGHSWPALERFELLWGVATQVYGRDVSRDVFRRDMPRPQQLTLQGVGVFTHLCPKLSTLQFTSLNFSGHTFRPPSHVAPHRETTLYVYIQHIFLDAAFNAFQAATFCAYLWPQNLIFPIDVASGVGRLSFRSLVYSVQALMSYSRSLHNDNSDKAMEVFKLLLASDGNLRATFDVTTINAAK